MAYVITGACIGVKDATCVATCPVDCILGGAGDPMLFIDPALCIDCGACMPVCPVNAIFIESEVPAEQAEFTKINKQYFENPGAALDRVIAIAQGKTVESQSNDR